MEVAASAPAKLILFGEHAVVYGRPALAVPLGTLRAEALLDVVAVGGLTIDAPDLGRVWRLADAPDDPLAQLVTEICAAWGRPIPAGTLTLRSQIPLASGMGSGAAIATAIVRALAADAGVALSPAEISALVFASERRLHGTPSGIDNTVVAFERPVWFVRSAGGPQIALLTIGVPLRLIIGDTGVRSATKLPVAEVRRRWQEERARYESLFDAVGDVALRGRAALECGDVAALGPLLDANHALLRAIGVSSPELDALVAAARGAGAAGAKLSGAGWGGVMIALVDEASAESVRAALLAAGAARALDATIGEERTREPV